MHRPLQYLPWLLGAAALPLQPVAAQSDGNDVGERVPERCISLTRVDRTEVVDDRTIIFHMRGGGGIYLNHLARECPGLEREERFMYSPTSNRLCDVDTVTVLERWGFGLTRGFTCSLGMFHPINEVELAELKQQKEQGGRNAAGGGGGAFEVEEVDPEEIEGGTGGDRSDDE